MPNGLPQSTSFQQPGPNKQLSGPLDFDLGGGVNVTLSGWNEARDYSYGVQANIHANMGPTTANVSGLSPNQLYSYVIYQFLAQPQASHWEGYDGFQVNGVAQPDTFLTDQTIEDNTPSAQGVATADTNGNIMFTFIRRGHVLVLSGMSISPAPAAASSAPSPPQSARRLAPARVCVCVCVCVLLVFFWTR